VQFLFYFLQVCETSSTCHNAPDSEVFAKNSDSLHVPNVCSSGVHSLSGFTGIEGEITTGSIGVGEYYTITNTGVTFTVFTVLWLICIIIFMYFYYSHLLHLLPKGV